MRMVACDTLFFVGAGRQAHKAGCSACEGASAAHGAPAAAGHRGAGCQGQRGAVDPQHGADIARHGQRPGGGPAVVRHLTTAVRMVPVVVHVTAVSVPAREDSESDGEDAQRAQKPIPDWARGRNVVYQLRAQSKTDPDEIFHPTAKTVNLQEIFGAEKRARVSVVRRGHIRATAPAKDGKPPKYSYSKRGSSCNWIEDRVTWKEELNYKKAMGYL